MDLAQAKRILEGILFVSDQPVTVKRLREAIGLEPDALRALLDELGVEYISQRRAFRVQEVAGGFQMVTDPDLAPHVKRALELPANDTLRKAALETLAIVAYKQPITKAEIELIRGVDGGATLDTLLDRQLVKVVGKKETPGRPLLYGTTPEFLKHFGLKDLSELPPMTDPATLPELQARPIVPPAPMPPASAGTSDASAVSEPAAVAQPTAEAASPDAQATAAESEAVGVAEQAEDASAAGAASESGSSEGVPTS
jgi:segregation and condensation protein B